MLDSPYSRCISWMTTCNLSLFELHIADPLFYFSCCPRSCNCEKGAGSSVEVRLIVGDYVRSIYAGFTSPTLTANVAGKPTGSTDQIVLETSNCGPAPIVKLGPHTLNCSVENDHQSVSCNLPGNGQGTDR